MATMQGNTFKVGQVQRRTLLQLFFTYSFIAVVAIISDGRPEYILLACLLSLLLTFNIPYNLHLLEITLARLAQGLPVEPVSSVIHWPLTRLFTLASTASQQTGQRAKMEQRNVAYRDQLLQQVGKNAAQEERNRLARDLHDSIKQQIFSIVVSAAAVKVRWECNPGSALKVLDDIERTAQEAQVEMQALLQQLRPTALENVGLIESLRMQCQALGYRTGATITAELCPLPSSELLPLGAQEMIFRIVQEGFANIARHARASQVWLSLRQQRNYLLVEIGDDGQGFDLARANERPHSYGGMGLSNIRDRVSALGGTVSIWSMSDVGTTIHLCFPFTQLQKEEQERESLEFTHAIRKAGRALVIGTWLAELAGAFLLTYPPPLITPWFILLCVIFAFAFWLWSFQYRIQLTLNFGRKRAEYSLLHAQSYSLISAILFLAMCLGYPNYLTSFSPLFLNTGRGVLLLASQGVFVIAIVTTSQLSLLHWQRYYKTLSRSALQKQFRQLLQQVVIDCIAWTLMFALTILVWNVLPANFLNQFFRDNITQVLGVVALIVWLLIILLKIARTIQAYRLLRRSHSLPSQHGGRI